MPSSATAVVFGAGRRRDTARLLVERGAARVLIVAQPRWSGLAGEVAAALGARHAGTFAGVTTQVPEGVVSDALAERDRCRPDWVLAIGGGSAVGVAKVLALESTQLKVAALPTTYAGSECTNIWGRVVGGQKHTGRDDRVRPSLVVHDPELQQSLPVMPSLHSLLNALAHSVEALYADQATDAARAAARDSLPLLWAALERLPDAPLDPEIRALALQGAGLASVALDGATMALHHKLAHVLGGAFGLPHGPTHATLLPHTLGFNQPAAPALRAAFAELLGIEDPAAALHDRMRARGLSVSLADLKVSAADVERAADLAMERAYANPRPFGRAEVASLLHAARLGRRPTADTTRVPLAGVVGVHGVPPASRWPASLETPERVVLAVHGRGANADRFIAQLRDLAPRATGVRFLAPQAEDCAWYPRGMGAPPQDNQPGLDSALSSLDAAWAEATRGVPAASVVVCGFSQGACLLLTWLAHRDVRPAAVLAFSGAALPGLPGDFASLRGVPVHLGISEEDPWVSQEHWSATARDLLAAGAQVSPCRVPGSAHELHGPDAVALASTLETLMNNDITRVSNPGDRLLYQTGLGNHLRSEAVPGSVPDRINSPRAAPHGLFAEQVNGSGFTVERARNLRTWMYRLRPSITRSGFRELGVDQAPPRFESDFSRASHTPEIQRYRPVPVPEAAQDWLDGVDTFAGAGSPALSQGVAVHIFTANRDMERVFVNVDGDMLLAPETGRLHVRTELGRLDVVPGEVVILPRGIRFIVTLPDGLARGFLLELYDGHFQLPERGVVGANGLADERHFKAPIADYEDRVEDTVVVTKQGGRFWQTTSPHSPFDVVGWHGRYAPFKYDLRDFMSMGSVSFDHPDPSILTVLTHPIDGRGRNAVDVGAFLGRWEPTEQTFRPPFFHRNAAVEFNMVISTPATAGGYPQGAFSFTPLLTPHGLGAHGHHHHAREADDTPVRIPDTSIWLQFESAYQLGVLPRWLEGPCRDGEFLSGFGDYTLGPLADGGD